MSENRCIGNDPFCPCQDGDVCHYVATKTTKAMPTPAPTPLCDIPTDDDLLQNNVDMFRHERNAPLSEERLEIDGECQNCGEMMATRPGEDATPNCDHCAHELLAALQQQQLESLALEIAHWQRQATNEAKRANAANAAVQRLRALLDEARTILAIEGYLIAGHPIMDKLDEALRDTAKAGTEEG